MSARERPLPESPEFWEQVKAALDRAREPLAPGPGADSNRLGAAYVGLLKLVLCDLTTSRTPSVDRTSRGLGSYELEGDELRRRALGSDWPLYGLTMVGLARLDDLEECVRTVVADEVEGHLIEAGAWRGGASMLMRAVLDVLGDERKVYVADSFSGFREDLRSEELAAIDYLAAPLAEVEANFARFGLSDNVEFIAGYFEDTLPALSVDRWAICRLDGDSYDATRLSLEALYPRLSVGGFLIVDDLFLLEESRRAVEEYRAEHGIEEPIEDVDSFCGRWRKEVAVPEPAGRPGPARPPAARPTPVRPAHEPIPTLGELDLRARLEEAEDELTRLRRRSWRGLLGRPG